MGSTICPAFNWENRPRGVCSRTAEERKAFPSPFAFRGRSSTHGHREPVEAHVSSVVMLLLSIGRAGNINARCIAHSRPLTPEGLIRRPRHSLLQPLKGIEKPKHPLRGHAAFSFFPLYHSLASPRTPLPHAGIENFQLAFSDFDAIRRNILGLRHVRTRSPRLQQPKSETSGQTVTRKVRKRGFDNSQPDLDSDSREMSRYASQASASSAASVPSAQPFQGEFPRDLYSSRRTLPFRLPPPPLLPRPTDVLRAFVPSPLQGMISSQLNQRLRSLR